MPVLWFTFRRGPTGLPLSDSLALAVERRAQLVQSGDVGRGARRGIGLKPCLAQRVGVWGGAFTPSDFMVFNVARIGTSIGATAVGWLLLTGSASFRPLQQSCSLAGQRFSGGSAGQPPLFSIFDLFSPFQKSCLSRGGFGHVIRVTTRARSPNRLNGAHTRSPLKQIAEMENEGCWRLAP